MPKVITVSIGIALVLTSSISYAQDSASKGAPSADKLGWYLGIQAFSFFRTTLFDTIDKAKELGIAGIEIIPFQRVSPERSKVFTNQTMTPEVIEEIKAKLKDADIAKVSFGVADLTNDETKCRQVFDLAKALGCKTITSEPPADALELVDSLCQEYGINVAIHNHPEPSLYWDPEKVAEALEGRSERMGVCADTSHWLRSGIDPLKALKKLEGRILTLHFGDVNTEALEALRKEHEGGESKNMMQAINKVPNVVWGTGGGDIEAWLAELKRQNFKGVFSIESFFELDPDQAATNVAQCVAYFEETVSSLTEQ